MSFHGAPTDNITSYLLAHKGLVTLELRPFPTQLMFLYHVLIRSSRYNSSPLVRSSRYNSSPLLI